MRIIAFYTQNTPYEKEIQNLEASCKRLGLTYHFEGYEGRGTWVHNCAIKPEFIWEMLHKFPNERLLYVDADAVIRSKPALAWTLNCDIAAHIMQGGVLLSGTILFNPNKRTNALVLEWVKKQKQKPNRWDQYTLHEVLNTHGPRLDIKFEELPQEYCKIFDKAWGEPVIEQMQASRRFKNLVKESIMEGVPAAVKGQRIRVSADGSFFIPRRHREAEKYLDTHYRRMGRELRWVKRVHKSKNLDALRPIFINKKCYIIGKGPSLDKLTASAFDDDTAPIIAINEAIHKVETLGLKNPLYVAQQDMGLRATCKPIAAAILVSVHAQHWYAETLNKYVYDPENLGVKGSQLTVICAIEIAKKLGTTEFVMVCFDACVTRETAYAKCIGYDSTKGGKPERFLKHKKHMANHLSKNVTWVIPREAPSLTSLYKPEKPSVHPVKRHVPVREESSELTPSKLGQSSKKEPSRPSWPRGHSDRKL